MRTKSKEFSIFSDHRAIYDFNQGFKLRTASADAAAILRMR
jgi:hypothetical protein